MKTWTRNPYREAICGGPCTRRMKQGDPMLEFRLPAGVPGRKDIVLIRCAACAGEPVPADLPPLAEPQPIEPTALIRVHQDVNVLPLDYKAAAAGREPGEDDE